jgi:hypothetical protein
VLFLDKAHGPGYEQMCHTFAAACKEWPHQPIQSEIVHVLLQREEEPIAYNRFASRFKPRQGILITPPLSVGWLMTTLLARGIGIPEAAEIVVVSSHPDAIRVHPTPAHYPFPLDAFVKTIVNTAVHFFETGTLSSIRKVLHMKMIPASPV